MPDQIPQPKSTLITVPLYRNWFVRHLLAEILSLAFVAAAIGLIYYFQIGSMPAVVPPPVHQAKVDVTKDWKTYTNGQYGLEFKYPPAWSVTSDHNSSGYYELQLNAADNSYLNIHIDDNPQNLSIPDYYKNKDASKIFTLNVIINRKFYTVSTSAEEYYIADNNNIYVIDIHADSSLIKPILSTFKFIEPKFSITDSAVAGQKVYKNTQYGFQFIFSSKNCVIQPTDTEIFISTECPATLGDLDGPEGFPRIGGVFLNIEDPQQIDASPNLDLAKVPKTQVNGLTVYHEHNECTEGMCGYSDFYYFQDPTHQYFILFNTSNFSDLVNQTISTFKFTASPVADMSLPFKVGDTFKNMKVVSASGDRGGGYKIQFQGQVTISGKYYVAQTEGPGCGIVFGDLDASSEALMPKVEGDSTSLCFNNNGLKASDYFKKPEGSATINIKDYELIDCGCDGGPTNSNNGTLLKVTNLK